MRRSHGDAGSLLIIRRRRPQSDRRARHFGTMLIASALLRTYIAYTPLIGPSRPLRAWAMMRYYYDAIASSASTPRYMLDARDLS